MARLFSTAQSLKINVPKGSSLVIRNQSGTETVTGSSVIREDASAVLGSGVFVYGPQTASSDVTISTNGACDYDIVAGDPTPATSSALVTRSASTGSPTGLIDPATGQAVGSGGGGMAVFRDMLLRGVPKRRPFLQQKHIIDYPTWTSGMTVAKGTTVKVAISGTNHLFTWLGDGGASTFASTTAPSVITSWKPQAVPEVAGSGSDVRGWVYMGLERRDLALASELTYSYLANGAPAGTVNIGAWNAAGPLRQVGDIENLDQASWVRIQSGDAIEGRTGSKRTDGSQYVGVSSIAFYTDSGIVAWNMNPDADNFLDGSFEVDDVPYAFSGTGTNISSNRTRVITFNTRRRRLIRIRNIGSIMNSLYLRSGEQIEPITDLLSQKVLWTGDSYQAGAAPGPIVIYGQPAFHASRNLGLPYFFLAAIGGRGYVATGGAGNNDLIDMLAQEDTRHKAAKYKAGFVCMSGNDNAVVSSTELVAAFVQVLQMYRSYMAYADSPIFVCTRYNGYTAGGTEGAAMNALMYQAIAQAGDPFVFPIAMGTDRSTGKPLLNDTNVASYIGASDIHPFDGGHRHYGDFVSGEVLRIMGLS